MSFGSSLGKLKVHKIIYQKIMGYFYIALLFPLFCCAEEVKLTLESEAQQPKTTTSFTRETVRADFFDPGSPCGLNLGAIIEDADQQREKGNAAEFSTYVVLYMSGIDRIAGLIKKFKGPSEQSSMLASSPEKKTGLVGSLRIKGKNAKNQKQHLSGSSSETSKTFDGENLKNTREAQSKFQGYFEQVGLTAEQIAMIPSLTRYRERLSSAAKPPRRLTQSDRRVGVYGWEELQKLAESEGVKSADF